MFPVNEEGCGENLKDIEIATEDTTTPCNSQRDEYLSAIPDVDSPLPKKDTTLTSTINTRKRKTSQVFVGHRKSPDSRAIIVRNLWHQEDKLIPLISKFGEVESVRYTMKNGVHTGAIITFVCVDSVVKALRGRPIKTKQNHEFLVDQKPKAYDNALKIFISNIVPSMRHVDLVEAFLQFGEIEEICVIGGESGAYGFVVFQYSDDASEALKQKFVSISGKGYVTVKLPKVTNNLY